MEMRPTKRRLDDLSKYMIRELYEETVRLADKRVELEDDIELHDGYDSWGGNPAEYYRDQLRTVTKELDKTRQELRRVQDEILKKGISADELNKYLVEIEVEKSIGKKNKGGDI